MVRPGKLVLILMGGGAALAGGGAVMPAVDSSSGRGGTGIHIGGGVTSPEQAGRCLLDGCTVELAGVGKPPNRRFFCRRPDEDTMILVGRSHWTFRS